MRVPLSWLKDFIPLRIDPTDHGAVAELGRVLDALGLVIESIEYYEGELSGIVVARVLAIDPIAGADRIRYVRVDAGPELGELGIVCGALNFAVGDLVPLAPVGTVLSSGMAIAARTMRGVESEGMLCSGQELGLSGDGEGLLILSVLAPTAPDGAAAVPGMALAHLLAIEPEAVFDIAVEPNRPDCLSIAGIARDLGARLSLAFAIPTPAPELGEDLAAELASVGVAESPACRQLVARVLLGRSAFPSTALVRRRLELAGQRPISAVVDASNYVMLELGQPSHPYDLDQLGNAGIAVRFARPGETLRTLDGQEHSLAGIGSDGAPLEDLVICDGHDEVIGLAGVMGGASSQIGPETSRVLLEVAEFDPLVIGRSAARQNLRTEASARFWRGIDPEGLDRAADRVCEIVQQAARAAGASVPLLARGPLEDRPQRFQPNIVRLSPARLNARLGLDLGAEEIARYLEAIGFSCAEEGDALAVTVPSFRPDCRLDVDLIEEVARHYGYERIVPRQRRSPYVGRLSALQGARRALRSLLVGYGAEEAWTPSIVDPTGEVRAGNRSAFVELMNPIVAGESILRSHLLPGLLTSLRYNEGQRNGLARLFEIGAVFSPPPPGAQRPGEQEQLGVLLALDDDDARRAEQLWEGLCAALRLEESALYSEQDLSRTRLGFDEPLALGCHPSRSAIVFSRSETGPKAIAARGEVDPEVIAAFGLAPRRLGWLVADLAALADAPRRSILARPVSKYPPSEIDLAFTLPGQLAASRLFAVIKRAGGSLLESLCLLDVYRGNAVSSDVRSLTYRLRFRALDHTLSEQEVASLRAEVIAAVRAELPAELRA